MRYSVFSYGWQIEPCSCLFSLVVAPSLLSTPLIVEAESTESVSEGLGIGSSGSLNNSTSDDMSHIHSIGTDTVSAMLWAYQQLIMR